MVAVKTELMPRRRDDLETDCECLVVQIGVMRGRSCLVATVYRPPDDPAALTEFYKCAQSAISTGSPTIFCGDFKLRYLRWSAVAETGITRHSFTRNCDRRQTLEFVDNLELYGFKQLVSEPTGESGTFLDLVLTDIPGSAALCDSVFSSDHHALRVEMCVCITRRPLPTRSRAFNYKRADWVGLRTALGLCPWAVLDNMEVNEAVDLFYDLVEAAVSDHVPTVTLSRKYPSWFDRNVRAALREKEEAFTAKKRHPTSEKELDFRSKRKFFKDLAASKYRSYTLLALLVTSKTHRNDSGHFSKAVKLSKALPSVLFFKEVAATSNRDKANILNDCFRSKFSVPSDSNVPLPFCRDLGLSALDQVTVSATRVASLLSTLDRSKACGSDNLSGFILRECTDVLAAIGVSRIWPRKYPQLAKWAPHISVGPHGHRAPYKTVISLLGFHQ